MAMTIQEYLDSIGLAFDDEQALVSFLSQSEVKDFLLGKYNEEKKDQEKGSSIESDNQTLQLYDLKETRIEIPISPETTDTMKYSDNNNPRSEAEEQQAKEEAFENQIKSLNFMLQNGRVNQAYSFSIDSTLIADNNIGDYWFEGLEEIGLAFNKETCTIEGTPTIVGDHKIVWHYKSKDAEADRPMLQRVLNLVINPDPRSLWNSIPTPENIAFYKPDSANAFLKGSDKNIIAASQRGRSHAHEGNPRDDDFAFGWNEENDWYILAVADGAGSAKYSRRGSQIACQTTIEVCSEQLKTIATELEGQIAAYSNNKTPDHATDIVDSLYTVLGEAIFKAYDNISVEAVNNDKEIRDFSTTLLLSICKRTNFGWFVASLWIGDGGIGIYDKEKQYLKILGVSDGGEFAGQTRFMTMSEIIQPSEIYNRLNFDLVEDFTALVLMTDGITDPKFETDANLMRIEKWNDLWNDINKEVVLNRSLDSSDQLLKWLDFWVPGNHDDRTIMILY